jgi:hypothetical protein
MKPAFSALIFFILLIWLSKQQIHQYDTCENCTTGTKCCSLDGVRKCLDNSYYCAHDPARTACHKDSCKRLSTTTDLCRITAHHYSYCLHPSTCVDDRSNICSGTLYFISLSHQADGSPLISSLAAPILLPDDIRQLLTRVAVIITMLGLLCLFLMRNKQPLRGRNLSLTVLTLCAPLLHVRFVLNQTYDVSCFITQAIAITSIVSDRVNNLIQVCNTQPSCSNLYVRCGFLNHNLSMKKCWVC